MIEIICEQAPSAHTELSLLNGTPMTSRLFEFGQTLPEYPVPVLNERAVRASAGILFVFAFA